MNNEKTYKLMGRVGGGTLALGIIVLVTGVVTGILMIVDVLGWEGHMRPSL